MYKIMENAQLPPDLQFCGKKLLKIIKLLKKSNGQNNPIL